MANNDPPDRLIVALPGTVVVPDDDDQRAHQIPMTGPRDIEWLCRDEDELTGPDDPHVPGKTWHLTGVFKKAT